ncbi:hypothetical protein LCGC14_3103940 [marine sediment metagenome]|uniref:Uncharacterized protein n=1 Tax=marine sediment metagenome TaxID=412755 RepID=A0A0F8W6Y8_9ZZZZ
MRSTNEIMIAVQECEPCTEEELRLCIAALQAKLYFAKKAANDMAKAIGDGQTKARFRAAFWKNDADRRFKAMKMPVDEYLGAGNTPGTSEHAERLRFSKAVVKKAIGVEL